MQQKVVKKGKIIEKETVGVLSMKTEKECVVTAAELCNSYLSENGIVKNRTAVCGNMDVAWLSRNKVPVVNVNADAIKFRDAGCVITMPQTNQELSDMIFLGTTVSEEKKVSLPFLIQSNSDNLREKVVLPTKTAIDKFIPNFKAYDTNVGPHEAVLNALSIYHKHAEIWKSKFKRSLSVVEYIEGENMIVGYGLSINTISKVFDRKINENDFGKEFGWMSVRMLRPFPVDEIKKALENAKKVLVVDSSMSVGYAGALYSDLKAHYRGLCSNVVVDRLSAEQAEKLFSRLKSTEKESVEML